MHGENTPGDLQGMCVRKGTGKVWCVADRGGAHNTKAKINEVHSRVISTWTDYRKIRWWAGVQA
jgi:hypothetical protein